jgi:hypothetical protein
LKVVQLNGEAMTNKVRTIIINSLIWGFVIVASAFILKGTPEKTRVISVLSLGYAASFSLVVGKKKE